MKKFTEPLHGDGKSCVFSAELFDSGGIFVGLVKIIKMIEKQSHMKVDFLIFTEPTKFPLLSKRATLFIDFPPLCNVFHPPSVSLVRSLTTKLPSLSVAYLVVR